MNEASPWTPGYNVVGDKLQRNIFTNKVDQKSVTTACGNNLGKYLHLLNDRKEHNSFIIKISPYKI